MGDDIDPFNDCECLGDTPRRPDVLAIGLAFLAGCVVMAVAAAVFA